MIKLCFSKSKIAWNKENLTKLYPFEFSKLLAFSFPKKKPCIAIEKHTDKKRLYLHSCQLCMQKVYYSSILLAILLSTLHTSTYYSYL